MQTRYVTRYLPTDAVKCAAEQKGWREGDGTGPLDWVDSGLFYASVDPARSFASAIRTARSCLPMDFHGEVTITRERVVKRDGRLLIWGRDAEWRLYQGDPDPIETNPDEAFDPDEET